MKNQNSQANYAFSPKNLRSCNKADPEQSHSNTAARNSCTKNVAGRKTRNPANKNAVTASDPSGPSPARTGASAAGVEATAPSKVSDPAGRSSRSRFLADGVETAKLPEPLLPRSGFSSEWTEVRRRAKKPKYCAELHIAHQHTGKLVSVNRSFTEYQPSAFICELTRTGTKVRLSSVVDRDNYECLLKRHKVPYSIGAGTIQVKKIVIKGLDPSVRPSDIQEDLEGLGFEVLRVVGMTSFRTKKPLPMFQAVLKDGPKVCEALKIKSLSYFKVKVEDYLPSKVPPQCTNCQMFHHTAERCRASPRCRYCAGSHHTKSCNKDTNVTKKCCHCGETHTANYKGCRVYKEITLQRKDKQKPRLGREPRTTSSGPQKLGAAKPIVTDSGKQARSTKSNTGKKVAADSSKQGKARSSDGSTPSKILKTKDNVDQKSQSGARSTKNACIQTEKSKGVDKKMQAQIDTNDCSCNLKCPKAVQDASCIMHSLAGVVKDAIKQQVTSFYIKVDLELDCSDNVVNHKCAQTISPRAEKRRVRHKKTQTDVPDCDNTDIDNAYEAQAQRYGSESCKCGAANDCTWLQWHLNCVQSKRENTKLVFTPVSRRTQ